VDKLIQRTPNIRNIEYVRIFSEFIPKLSLQPYVSAVRMFHIDLPPGETFMFPGYPNSESELFVIYSGQAFRNIQFEPNSVDFPADGFLLGPRMRTNYLYLMGNAQIINVSIRTGFADVFSRGSFRNQKNGFLVCHEDLWTEDERHQIQKSKCSNWNTRYKLLEQLLEFKIRGLKPLPSIISASLDYLASHTHTKIKHFLNDIHQSERTVERYFRDWLHITPSEYLRILRFSRLLVAFDTQTQSSNAQKAQGLGFFDESHMYNDVVKLTGIKLNEIERIHFDLNGGLNR
jgi:AraC-like DNA-binding protein